MGAVPQSRTSRRDRDRIGDDLLETHTRTRDRIHMQAERQATTIARPHKQFHTHVISKVKHTNKHTHTHLMLTQVIICRHRRPNSFIISRL